MHACRVTQEGLELLPVASSSRRWFARQPIRTRSAALWRSKP